MRIQAAGRILVGRLTLVTLLIGGIGYGWMTRFNQLDSIWHDYRLEIDKRVSLLSLMDQSMGYGGMIHNLKNYVLRGKLHYLYQFYRSWHEMNIALVGYSHLSLSESEEKSLEALKRLHHNYFQAALKAEQLMAQQLDSKTIDGQIKVDDSEAIAAIEILTNLTTKKRHYYLSRFSAELGVLKFQSLAFGLIELLLLFLLAGYFLWFIRHWIVTPIGDLLLAFDRIDPLKQASERLPVSTGVNKTELDELAMAGNRFLAVVETQLEQQLMAQREAIENEQRISTILNSAAEGIITINSKGIIQTFNPKCEVLFEWLSGEIIGQNVNVLMQAEDRVAHQNYVENTLEIQQKIIGKNRDLWGKRKDGSVFPMELTVSQTTLNGERCFVGILHDISVRKANEARLMAAKEDAEKANRAKSQFLSAMSHELRTPLNAILGFSQLMLFHQKDKLSPIQYANTEQILQAGEHLLRLINDILDLTKIETGHFEIEFAAVSLAKVVSQCIELVQHQADKSDITLIVDDSINEHIYLYSNFTRFSQVILNFLTNAIKYNRPHGQVTLSCEVLSDQRLKINVTDTGYGISIENHAKVFEPFQRFDQNVLSIEGTGIGLSVSASLVAAMAGEIGFDSVIDQGSTFYLILPLFSANDSDPDLQDLQ